MDTKKLDKWAQLLLDTSKRNKLVNFKDSKSSTLEIVCPDAALLFGRCDADADFEVVGPRPSDEKSLDDPLRPQSEEDFLPKEEYISRYASLVKKAGQLLVYGKLADPLSVMKVLDKKSRSALDETGVNVSYLAFGFVRWKENKEASPFFLAPLLLVPVSLESKSAVSPWHIKPTGDDIVVNPTLDYIMHSEYNICLPEYMDGEGLTAYLDRLREIVQPLGWSVTAECKLGSFSFLKMNMYRDMKDNADLIMQNANVRILLGEGAETAHEPPQGRQAQDTPPLSDIHAVVDADSSQLKAIALARSGKSFVLQGPPGTGKSQTITNIIAECLYNGRKVLFVSEKQAALNVVHDKLKAAGLSDFCLELHSHKSSKKAVIDELCRTLRAERYRLTSRADKEIQARDAAMKKLDLYASELHRTRQGLDCSIYELYSALASVKHAPDVPYIVEGIRGRDAAYLSEMTSLLGQYADYTGTVGEDYKQNAWYGYRKDSLSYEEKTALQDALSSLAAAIRELIPICSDFSGRYGLSCEKLCDCHNWEEALSLLSTTDVLVPALLDKNRFSSVLSTARQMAQDAEKISQLKSSLDSEFEGEIYKKNGQDWNNRLKKQFQSVFSRLFSKDYKGIMTELRLASRTGRKFRYEEAVRQTGALREYQELLEEFAGCEARILELTKPVASTRPEESLTGGLGTAYTGLQSDWNHILGELSRLEALHDRGMDFALLPSMDGESFAKEKAVFASYAQKFSSIRVSYASGIRLLQEGFSPEAFSPSEGSLTDVLAKCQACLAEMGKLDNWMRFHKLLGEIGQKGAFPYIQQVISMKIPPALVVDCYLKAFYSQAIHALISDIPELADFSRVSQDKAVSVFAEKDRLQFEISRIQIQEKLAALRPSLDMLAPKSPVSILLREGEKKRKQKSIRTLIAETGDLVQILKPCFLMSPLSVSMFLSSGISFDTVVFDEASQIFPQDAVGAVYRGRQLIVVGDSKQMPPSNFFNNSMEMEGDEDFDDVTDFESILDMCSPSLPQSSLLWHYRSRYEQLIAFSNKNFYGGSLMTFPSASGGLKGTGVDYYHVDGIFDRKNHTNLAEAERVADLVFENARLYPSRSLGVVAFSVSQQNLIDSLLSRKRQQDPTLEEFFSRDKEQPFFVKNLETVQGDERDTIILSVAYGHDAEGKLLHNFGPLNRQGGERRLNVAVTRAKINVQLVSSMHGTDIDLGRTNSEGARLLKDYLEYAEHGEKSLGSGSTPSQSAMTRDEDRRLETEVAEFLSSKGYKVEMQVGCGSSKIDIAVRRADGSYALAVECDGANYKNAANTRDRDRLRAEQLTRMGWHYYRVWSTDWFKNCEIEKERLCSAAEAAMTDKGITGTEKTVCAEQHASAAGAVAEIAPQEHVSFPVYKEADVSNIVRSAGIAKNVTPDKLKKIVKSILDVESPLSEEILLKRICFLFGREKVTTTVKQLYDGQMSGCEDAGIIRKDGFLYLAGQRDFQLRVPGASCQSPREIRHIALEELASGIYTVLKQNISADKDSLYRTLTVALGFGRPGEAMTARLNQALRLLGDTVRLSGNILSLAD